MSLRFFLAGHESLRNRGCEALVRSIVQILRGEFPGCEFVVPSREVDFDARQWPEAADAGVQFVPCHQLQDTLRWWSRLHRLAPRVAALRFPTPDLPAQTARLLDRCDAVIVTGGDVLSLDYSVGALFHWAAQIEAAMRRSLPVLLWSSSVGPFSADRRIEAFMAGHLKRYAATSTRESHSQAYLAALGVAGSVQCTDPAFVLRAQAPADAAALLPSAGPAGTLGLNISPVIARARERAGITADLLDEVAQFVTTVVEQRGLAVALVPHVDAPGRNFIQQDTPYMQPLVQRLRALGDRVRLVPETLNAPQLKYLLSQCRYFIGARTHATIAALSTGVPTVSIAYSVKARGINEDLFGDLRYMLDTQTVSALTLLQSIDRLIEDEAAIRQLLADRVPKWKERATLPARLVRETVGRVQKVAEAA